MKYEVGNWAVDGGDAGEELADWEWESGQQAGYGLREAEDVESWNIEGRTGKKTSEVVLASEVDLKTVLCLR